MRRVRDVAFAALSAVIGLVRDGFRGSAPASSIPWLGFHSAIPNGSPRPSVDPPLLNPQGITRAVLPDGSSSRCARDSGIRLRRRGAEVALVVLVLETRICRTVLAVR
jgi:hypothetical protein